MKNMQKQSTDEPLGRCFQLKTMMSYLNCYVASMGFIFKTDVPQMNHFIIRKKSNHFNPRSGPPFPKSINDKSCSDASRASGCGVDQEAGEGVAGAALTHKGVIPGGLQ